MLSISRDSDSLPIQALLALNHPLEMQLCPTASGSSVYNSKNLLLSPPCLPIRQLRTLISPFNLLVMLNVPQGLQPLFLHHVPAPAILVACTQLALQSKSVSCPGSIRAGYNTQDAQAPNKKIIP